MRRYLWIGDVHAEVVDDDGRDYLADYVSRCCEERVGVIDDPRERNVNADVRVVCSACGSELGEDEIVKGAM